MQIIQNAGQFARDKDWTARELEEGKLGVFQQIDAPTSVRSDGSKEFMYGITQDMDQMMRERLLNVTKRIYKRLPRNIWLMLQLISRQSVYLVGRRIG